MDVATKFIKSQVESSSSNRHDDDYNSEDFEWCFFVCLEQNKSWLNETGRNVSRWNKAKEFT